MTIFQKMLIVPLLSLVIYAGFIMYSYSGYQKSNNNIVKIRDNYIPLLDVAAENLQKFKETSQIFKDAVLAGEASWVKDTITLKNNIDSNFIKLSQFKDINERMLNQAQQQFELYYTQAQTLALNIISNENENIAQNESNASVQLYFIQTDNAFKQLRQEIYKQFKETIDATSRDMNQLLFWGSTISLLLILLFTGVIFVSSFSTRKNLWLMNRSMKSLALDGTDFSRRLKPTSRDELGTLIYWFNQLSVKLEGEHKQLEKISNTDKLTGLNNRMSTDNFIEYAISTAINDKKPLSVAIADIDFFKSINDKYGHQVGDEVLIAFADILRKSFKGCDFVGRWGGEEFIIVLVDTRLETAIKLIEKLRVKIQYHEFNKVGQLTASFGLSSINSNDNSDSLFKRIDKKLYKAKENGRNQVIADDI